jgi:hypothetical protein
LKLHEKPITATISLSEYLESQERGYAIFDPQTTIISMPLSFWLDYEQHWLDYHQRVEDRLALLQGLMQPGVMWTTGKEATR